MIDKLYLLCKFIFVKFDYFQGAKVDLKTDTNATPLLYAAICGNITIASILIEAGADVNNYDMEGNSPIIHAAK